MSRPTVRGALWICARLALIFLCAVPASADDAPRRVASINLCTDLLLLELADPETIVSLSYLARDARSSYLAERARDFPQNRGRAEEMARLRPDIVFLSPYSDPQTSEMLRRIGLRTVAATPPTSIDAYLESVRVVAEALGRDERGDALIRRFQAERDRLRGDRRPRDFVLADYGVNGWTSGNQSLLGELVHLAGLRTLADQLGFDYGRQTSLETLIAARPDAIAFGYPWSDPPARASETLRHPALRRLAHDTPTLRFSEPLLTCGAPHMLQLVERFRELGEAS